tara:strand:- start:3248 stop:3601 length:354 start_codon:yes stop_codon:yes gene_type:complete
MPTNRQEYLRDYGVKYREDNKKKLKENDSLRYYYNQDKKLQAAKDRYAANPEEKNEYDKEYNQTFKGVNFITYNLFNVNINPQTINPTEYDNETFLILINNIFDSNTLVLSLKLDIK